MQKYVYYIIRMDFDDGSWGYVRYVDGGRLAVTDDPNSAILFDSHDEAANYYYDNIGKDAECNGAKLRKLYITTIGSDYPL